MLCHRGKNKKQTNEQFCGHITLAVIQGMPIEICLCKNNLETAFLIYIHVLSVFC